MLLDVSVTSVRRTSYMAVDNKRGNASTDLGPQTTKPNFPPLRPAVANSTACVGSEDWELHTAQNRKMSLLMPLKESCKSENTFNKSFTMGPL